MNWDWDKLSQNRQRQSSGGQNQGPNLDEFNKQFGKLKGFRFSVWKIVVPLLLGLWLLSGFYVVGADEQGVVRQFGAYDRTTGPGLNYHLPFPIESALTPKVTIIRRAEVGLRSIGRGNEFVPGQFREVPEESLMLTGDENIVDVQFIVQYLVSDPVKFLFQVRDQALTVKNAAEAAMREVIGYNKIDAVLTTDKLVIQNETRDLMQEILDRYEVGIQILAVNLQDVHPPKEVIDAFKDVASAREDKARLINEAEAYSNDILPQARGEAAQILNKARAYKEQAILRAEGEAKRFSSVLTEYEKAPEVTRKRLYLETMEKVMSNPNAEKIIITDGVADKMLPYLPLDRLTPSRNNSGGQ
jgi:membrane protease subunit HflK